VEPAPGHSIAFWEWDDPHKGRPVAVEGDLSAHGMRFAVVVARWNAVITDRLLRTRCRLIRTRGDERARVALGHVDLVPVHAAVAGLIAACGGVGTAGRARDWASALLEAAPDDRARAFVTELATEPLQVSGEPDEKYADVILARVGELSVGREIAAIKARLQRMNPEEDQAGYGRMFGELVALEQRRKWLLDRATGA